MAVASGFDEARLGGCGMTMTEVDYPRTTYEELEILVQARGGRLGNIHAHNKEELFQP